MASDYWTWARSKEFVTKLQEAPEPPVIVPAVPYPEEEGVYQGSRYYSAAISRTIIDELLANYLSFLEQSKDVVLTGRGNAEVKNLALSITEGRPTTYEKAKAIHGWVHQNVEYQRTEYIIPPWDLIRPGASGDCKSFAALVGSLLGLAGIPCWLKLVRIGTASDLHIYDFASLTWAIVDAVGSHFLSEVKPVSGYVIYEIDRTGTWPPRVLPSGAEIEIPEKLKKALPLIGAIGGTIGAVTLAFWMLK